jgi:hypothetical protein
LFSKDLPLTCDNFKQLCTGGIFPPKHK